MQPRFTRVHLVVVRPLVLLFFTGVCIGDILGQEKIQSRIVDEYGKGIPFASIGIIEKNIGAVTFEDGSFTLSLDQNCMGDTLVLSAVGFQRSKISYREFVTDRPELLQLKEDIVQLKEVVISPEKLTYSEIGMRKNSSPNHLAISSPMDGATVAMLFEDISEPVVIEKIAVTIRQVNMDSMQVRCRFFEIDPETRLPGKDLLDENLIAICSEEQQRLTFRPSKDIWLDKPFFVGFEWIMTKNQFKKLQQAKDEFPTDFIDVIVSQNPGFNYNVNENKRVQFRDEQGNLVKKVSLTKDQSAILDAKDAASPRLQFKIKIKGTRTFTGSPITGQWEKSPHEVLISVTVGKNKKANDPEGDVSENKYFSFGGQPIAISDLHSFLDKKMHIESIPGLSMVVFNEAEIIHYVVKGYENVEESIPVTENTIFEAASLSKPLFAYFVMKFVDAGLLDLDRPLFEYYPFDDIADDERYKKINARMVLSHTSGFPNWRNDHDGELFISFEPGTDYQYSGEGYQYLEKVLEHLLETDEVGMEKTYQMQIAEPLGLKTTKFLQDKSNLNNKAKPYKDGKRVQIRYNNDTFGAAFSVHSESKDFSIWLRALLSDVGLRKESFRELFSDQVLISDDGNSLNGAAVSAWTLGFGKYEVGEDVYYGHGGNNPGYTSGFFIDRERKLGAVIFTNADQVSEFVIDTFRFLIEY